MAKYESWSLREIKAAMRDANGKLHQMSTLYEAYAEAANSLDTIAGDLHAARSGVQAGWQGPASDSSATAVQRVVTYSHGSRDAAKHMANLNQKLARSTAHHHDLVDGVPDVDTSWAASMQSSYMNPFMALPDHDERVYHATKNQQLAASHARALDHVSGEWEHDMKKTDWPAKAPAKSTLPPRTLPTRQQQPVRPEPPQPPPTPRPPTPQPPDPKPTPPVHKPPTGDPTHSTGDNVDPTSVLTAGAHGAGSGSATGTGTGSVGGLGSGGGSGSGSGLGGLGGSGLIGGLGGLGGGGSRGSGGDGGGSTADRAAQRSAGARVGTSEETAERAGARTAAGAAAGERGAGGMMGAPMGGGRRGNGDEEHKRPDYLEDDDVWGADQDGVPPVLGEDY